MRETADACVCVCVGSVCVLIVCLLAQLLDHLQNKITNQNE